MSAEMGGRARGAGIGRAHLVVQQEPVRVRLVRADVLVRCTIVGRVSMGAGQEEWVSLARARSPSSIFGSERSAMAGESLN